MENNEIMNLEAMDDMVVVDEKPGLGTGAAMLIGAGIAVAVGATVKLVKTGIAAFRAKKAAREAAEAQEVEDYEVIDK